MSQIPRVIEHQRRLAERGAETGSGLTRRLDGLLCRCDHPGSVAAAVVLAALVLVELYGSVAIATLGFWLAGITMTGLAIHGVETGCRPWLQRSRRWGIVLTALTVLQALAWSTVLWCLPLGGAGVETATTVYALSAVGLLGVVRYSAFPPASIGFALVILAALGGWLVASEGNYLVPVLLAMVLPATAALWTLPRWSARIRRGLRIRDSRHRLEAGLRASLARAETALEWVTDGVIVFDDRGVVQRLNAAAERLTGWSASAARGRSVSDVMRLIEDNGEITQESPVTHCLTVGEAAHSADGTMLRARGGGRETAVEVSVHPTPPGGGAVAVVRDVAALRGMARLMSYQANHDALTGLLNRNEFEARLSRAVEEVRHAGAHHVLAYLDLDQFKLVNDTCGHEAGDELLSDVAERIRGCAARDDVVARIGGDEFGLLLRHTTADAARARLEAIRGALQKHRFTWKGKVFPVGCSIGMAPVEAEATPADLFAAADAACYVAKEQGRNRVRAVHPQDHELIRHQDDMAWTSRIQHALEQGRVRLRFQRIAPLRDGLPVMAELLLTLVDESGEMVAPTAFLPAAERFGLMHTVDREVVHRVFAHVARADDNPLLCGIDVFSLNISGQSLSNAQFLDYCLRELRSSRVDPARICFEITETAVVANIDRARIFIEALREHGCRFALDDFGSGVSSFGYLRSLPVDCLKIDGQFVRHIAHDPIDRSMVASINEVGQMMGVRTIAEVVETEPVREVLEEMGVDYAQGYGVHRPQYLD